MRPRLIKSFLQPFLVFPRIFSCSQLSAVRGSLQMGLHMSLCTHLLQFTHFETQVQQWVMGMQRSGILSKDVVTNGKSIQIGKWCLLQCLSTKPRPSPRMSRHVRHCTFTRSPRQNAWKRVCSHLCARPSKFRTGAPFVDTEWSLTQKFC